MGKVFITDEVNDQYTADVTNAGKVKVEIGAAGFSCLDSAYSVASGQRVASTACYLKNVIIGEVPQTAGSVWLYNSSSATLANLSAFGTSGDNIIGKITYRMGAASAMVCGVANYTPVNIPFDCYCSSGLIAAISPSATAGLLGCFKGVTIVYQT